MGDEEEPSMREEGSMETVLPTSLVLLSGDVLTTHGPAQMKCLRDQVVSGELRCSPTRWSSVVFSELQVGKFGASHSQRD